MANACDTDHIKAVSKVVLANGLNVHRVLVVPVFEYSLLSVAKLSKDSDRVVVFYLDCFLIQDSATQKLKGIGKHRAGLYYLLNLPTAKLNNKVLDICDKVMLSKTPGAVNNVVVPSISSRNADASVWHHILGHAPLSKLRYITCVPKPDTQSQRQVGITYPLAKFFKLPYSLSNSHNHHIFDLIQIDIWGPYRAVRNIGIS